MCSLKFISFISVLTVFLFSACFKREIVKPPESFKPQRLLWSSSQERPNWIDNEPEKDGDKLCFVGLSEYHSTENDARNAAMRSAQNAVVSYISVSVKQNFKQISARYGKSSDISDPTVSSKEFSEYIKNSIVSRIKAYNWYIEQWLNLQNEVYWKVYVLVKVPEDAIKQAIIKTSEDFEKFAKEESEQKKIEQRKSEQQTELLLHFLKKTGDKLIDKIDKKKEKNQ